MGKSPSEAYYLSRVIGLAGEGEFRHALQSVRETGYPARGGVAYAVERAAIQIRDLPGGMILILLTFFASLFAFVWATQTWDTAEAGTIFFVSLGLIAAGGADVDLRDLYRYLYQVDKQVAPALGVVSLVEIDFPLLSVLMVSEIPIRSTPPQH